MLFSFFERINKIENNQIEENQTENLDIENSDITQEEAELAKKLDAVQEFSIDRFEENIAVLENRESGELINIEVEKLPEDVKEGDILKCINGKYILDKNRTNEETENIKEEMNSLWED